MNDITSPEYINELGRHAPRLSVEDRFKLIALINGMQKPFLGISGDPAVRDHLAFLRRIEAWINSSTVMLTK